MSLLRRIFKQGHSPVVAIPPDFLRQLEVDIGDNVTVSVHQPKRGPTYIKLKAYDENRDGYLDARSDLHP